MPFNWNYWQMNRFIINERIYIQYELITIIYDMNPLGLSIVFVVGSIFLSFMKTIVFPSTQPTSSVIKFNKVFQLTNNKIEAKSKYYKSLYEAFHKSQTHDIQKFTNMLPNKESFNQNILSNSLRNQQKSLLCGSDYLLLVSSAISTDTYGYTELMNTIYVYKLPLMKKISQIKIRSPLTLPRQCKRSQKNQYNVVLTSTQQIIWIKVQEDKVKYSKIKQYKRSFKQLDKLDFDEGWIAYSNRERPWIVQIKQLEQHNSTDMDKLLQIDLIDIQNQKWEDEQYQFDYITMNLKIRHVFLTKQNESLLLTVIYDYHQNNDMMKKIKMVTFEVNNTGEVHTMANFEIDFGNYMLIKVFTECNHYLNKKTNKFDVSCLITRQGQSEIKFINFLDIYTDNHNNKHNHNHSEYEQTNMNQNNESQQTMKYYEDQQNNEQLYYQYDYVQISDQADDDLQWMLQSMAPGLQIKPKSKPQTKSMKVTLKFISSTKVQLLKASTPDPIIFYEDKGYYYLFSFNMNSLSVQEDQFQLPSLNYRLQRPASSKIQQRQLRNIGWIQDQKLIVVLWGAGVEVYQFNSVDLQQTGDGIAMSVIIPFIQLFATVFCLLRIVWTTE